MFLKDLPNSECQMPFEGECPLEDVLRISTLELTFVIKTRRHSQCPDSLEKKNPNNSIVWGTETSRLYIFKLFCCMTHK